MSLEAPALRPYHATGTVAIFAPVASALSGWKASIAAAMKHVDRETEPRLERIMSEIRTHRKRLASSKR